MAGSGREPALIRFAPIDCFARRTITRIHFGYSFLDAFVAPRTMLKWLDLAWRHFWKRRGSNTANSPVVLPGSCRPFIPQTDGNAPVALPRAWDIPSIP